MLYPLTFEPIFKERIWGGRQLEQLYGKRLPAGRPIGESWEISDRPGDVSKIANGPLAGKDLHWLVENHGPELFGPGAAKQKQFPLLIKILDAREKLSLQVHPPAAKAAELGGEPKTEMWYVADADPDAELYVGLRHSATRVDFERKSRDGTVTECFHRIPVTAGDVMFLPSGRVHAIGAGLVIFEIQQNSDTTYRVFDWNRVGLDGKPRELHASESLASIDFNDFEPSLVGRGGQVTGSLTVRPLVDDPLFKVEAISAEHQGSTNFSTPELSIVGVVHGEATVTSASGSATVKSGGFCLLPWSTATCEMKLKPDTTILLVRLGE